MLNNFVFYFNGMKLNKTWLYFNRRSFRVAKTSLPLNLNRYHLF